MTETPLDIERAARVLIVRFGNDSAIVAWRRAEYCKCHGLRQSEAEWRKVLKRVIELYFRPQRGTLH